MSTGREPWRSTRASRPLDRMGHASRHLPDFLRLDPTLTPDDVAKILDHVRLVGAPSPTRHGGISYEADVEIGGTIVLVKVIETSAKTIKTGFPVDPRP